MLQAEEAVEQEAAEGLREDWRSRQGGGGAWLLHPSPRPPQALRLVPHPCAQQGILKGRKLRVPTGSVAPRIPSKGKALCPPARPKGPLALTCNLH